MSMSEQLLTVHDAQAIVLRHSRPLSGFPYCTALSHLSAALMGQFLAEDVRSDVDMPPFDKALMDGYAVRSADLAAGPRALEVIEEITAGNTPQREVGPGQAVRIMTGCPCLPGRTRWCRSNARASWTGGASTSRTDP